MSNHTHINWIFNLLKELQDDDDHKHDLDYSPDSSEKSPDPTFEMERQLMAHFSVHPKIYGNSKTQPTMCLVYYVIASYSNRWGVSTCTPQRPAQNLQYTEVWSLQ